MIRLVLSHAGMAASGLGLVLSAAMVSDSPAVQAQGEPQSSAQLSDGLLVIPGIDGAPVGLRSGPAFDQPVVVHVGAYELVTPLGAAHFDGATHWLPVKTAGNQVGWIAEQHLAGVGVSPPAPSPSAEIALAALPPPPVAEGITPGPPPPLPPVVDVPAPAAAAPPVPPPLPAPAPVTAPVRMEPSAREATTAQTAAPSGKSLEIETKLKYPEAKTRHQEITIWVTRDGAPVTGAVVTVFIEDDEDEPVRVLEPTNADGRTRREFAIGQEKGSIELVVSAVAPDGVEGRTTATYFRR